MGSPEKELLVNCYGGRMRATEPNHATAPRIMHLKSCAHIVQYVLNNKVFIGVCQLINVLNIRIIHQIRD